MQTSECKTNVFRFVRSGSRFRVSTHVILHPEVLISTLSNFNFTTFDANTKEIKTLALWCSLPQAFQELNR
jgi:hypothetical protein